MLVWKLLIAAMFFSLTIVVNAENLALISLQKTPAQNEVFVNGKVEAVYESTVSAETAGRVQEILFDIGDEVAAGEAIIKLVSNEQQQAYNQALAAYTEAEVNYQLQAKEFKRIDEVYKKQLVAKSEYDKALGSVNTAKARMESVRAAVAAAKERLSYTVVKAPFAGVVSSRWVELGEAVQPGKPLMSGFNATILRVEAGLSSALAVLLKQENKARIVLDQDQSIQPTRIEIFPTVDVQSGAISARFYLPEQKNHLMPGTWVKVAITTSNAEKICIPISAVAKRSELSAIYVKTPLGPVLRQVRLGKIDENKKIEILAGVEVGEVIYADALSAAILVAKSNLKTHE